MNNTNYLLAVGGAYLLYLAFKLVMTYIRGEASLGVFNILIAVFFAAVGGWVIFREWKRYRGKDKGDK